jgi:hypothetical protein
MPLQNDLHHAANQPLPGWGHRLRPGLGGLRHSAGRNRRSPSPAFDRNEVFRAA